MPLLIAGGIFATILPLLASAVYAELTLQNLAQTTRTVVEEGFATAAITVRLRSQTSNLERAIWQYQVLKTPSLLPIITHRWESVDQSVLQLGNLHSDAPLKAKAALLQQRFAEARKVWRAATADTSPADAAAGVDPVKALQSVEQAVEAAIQQGHQQITARAMRLRTQMQRTQRRIFWLEIVLLLLVIGLGFAFAKLIGTPFRRLTQSIVTLRNSDYDTPIEISYPSEFQLVGKQLDRLRLRLARLRDDKDSFLRRVTHELKSPLASLREGVGLLDGEGLGALTPPQREVTGIMHDASLELEELINNLLAYAEWRFDQHTARNEWFDADELLEEVLSSQRLPMSRRKLTTKVDIRSPRLLGRREQLRVALDNLVSNAVKHAPRYTAIEISVASDDAHFEISVRDSGTGVREADKQAIFEPFWRGAENEEQGVGGTGVGLAIVMETIRAHGGDIVVEDAHPGARFIMLWPGRSA